MSAREVLAKAASLGEVLGENEARVALANEEAVGGRAWIGADFHDRPVAYFEIDTPGLPAYDVSNVISVRPVETVIGRPSETVRAVKVICRDNRLDEVFLALMDDVIARLDSGNAVEVLVSAAAEWRELLRLASTGLSDTAATGLYGELRFLEALIAGTGPQLAETWQRSGHDMHDFIGEHVRVEVKTSDFQNRDAVTVHGLRQLSPPEGADLVLAVAEIQRHGDGECLDDVVDRLLDAGTDLELLTQKLERAGFARGASRLLDNLQVFTLHSWRFWEITAASPVLSTASVREEVVGAVGDVSYSLHLSALREPADNFDWSRFDHDHDRG